MSQQIGSRGKDKRDSGSDPGSMQGQYVIDSWQYVAEGLGAYQGESDIKGYAL